MMNNNQANVHLFFANEPSSVRSTQAVVVSVDSALVLVVLVRGVVLVLVVVASSSRPESA